MLQDNHNVVDLTAFNTDGFDVSGRNVWIHDCTVWNQGRNEKVNINKKKYFFDRKRDLNPKFSPDFLFSRILIFSSVLSVKKLHF